MVLLDCEINGANYALIGDYGLGKEFVDDIFDPLSVEVYKDYSLTMYFGQTWIGLDLDNYDALGYLISAYVNDQTDVKFNQVCEEIKAYKENNQTYTHTVNGRKIPNMIVTPKGNIGALHVLTQTKDGKDAFGYYFSDDVSCVTRMDGSIATDIKEFAINSLVEDLEDNKVNVLYISDEAKQWLKDDFELDLQNDVIEEFMDDKSSKIKMKIIKQDNFYPDGSSCWNAQIWTKVNEQVGFVYCGNGRFCKSLEEAEKYKEKIFSDYKKKEGQDFAR